MSRWHTEVERILREYSRRARELPRDYWSVTKPTNLFMKQSRDRELLRMLSNVGSLPLYDKRILDIGCSTGQTLVDFETWGARRANLCGIDLDARAIRASQQRLSAFRDDMGRELAGGADLRTGDATSLPWRDEQFDIVCQGTVFSSILDGGMRKQIANEMTRVIALDGIIVWYDFFLDNPRNPNVRGVTKSEIKRLFPGFDLDVSQITLAPPLSRRLVPRSWMAAVALERLRVFNTHLLVVLQRIDTHIEASCGMTRR